MSTPEKSPAFQFYPKDWLTDSRVALMSLEAKGLYIDALCVCWLEGSLPADEAALAKLLKVHTLQLRKLWREVGGCFTVSPLVTGGVTGRKLVQKRLENERGRQADRRARMSEMAQKRWNR